VGVAILLSDKIDFKIKAIIRDNEGHYLTIKGSIGEENITIINMYAPKIGAPQYIRQLLVSMISLPFTLLFLVQSYTLLCVFCLENILWHLLKSWFGGPEFSPL